MQLVEDPLNPDSAADGIAKVIPIFDETFQVLREEEVYPILSFVADIGGILGLFIGFNFLLVWDWMIWLARKMFMKIKSP